MPDEIYIVMLFLMTISCRGQINLNDKSLKTDVTLATNSCECNDWAKLYLNEQIAILTEIKRLGKTHKDVTFLNEEYQKRAEKYYTYFKHCQPLYNKEGLGEKCNGYKELAEADKRYSALLNELGMQ